MMGKSGDVGAASRWSADRFGSMAELPFVQKANGDASEQLSTAGRGSPPMTCPYCGSDIDDSGTCDH